MMIALLYLSIAAVLRNITLTFNDTTYRSWFEVDVRCHPSKWMMVLFPSHHNVLSCAEHVQQTCQWTSMATSINYVRRDLPLRTTGLLPYVDGQVPIQSIHPCWYDYPWISIDSPSWFREHYIMYLGTSTSLLTVFADVMSANCFELTDSDAHEDKETDLDTLNSDVDEWQQWWCDENHPFLTCEIMLFVWSLLMTQRSSFFSIKECSCLTKTKCGSSNGKPVVCNDPHNWRVCDEDNEWGQFCEACLSLKEGNNCATFLRPEPRRSHCYLFVSSQLTCDKRGRNICNFRLQLIKMRSIPEATLLQRNLMNSRRILQRWRKTVLLWWPLSQLNEWPWNCNWMTRNDSTIDLTDQQENKMAMWI